jgi:hypothetical protein
MQQTSVLFAGVVDVNEILSSFPIFIIIIVIIIVIIVYHHHQDSPTLFFHTCYNIVPTY